MFHLDGKIALITGSSRGLGFTLARGLARAGAVIVLNGRNNDTLQKAVDVMIKEGFDTYSSAFNVNDEKSVSKEVNRIENEIGPVEILINNAGIQKRGSLEECSVDDWNEIMNVNLTGAFITAKAVVRGMKERKQGKIINVCSLMSEIGRSSIAAYTASKGGLKMLTKAMTVEWAKYNIQINGIGPGYFITEMTKPLAEDPEFDKWIKRRTPAGRWGKPEELIGATVFLASEASNFVNGQIIYVDGGLLAAI